MKRCAVLFVGLGLVSACQEYNLKSDPDDNDVTTDTAVEETEVVEDTDVEPTLTPDIEVEPLQIDFGYLPSECASEGELVTIRNVGDGDLQINAIFFTDAVGAFSHDADSSMVLAPDESYQFDVSFLPPVEGDFLDYVRIASNDPDESTVDITTDGTGLQ